MPDARDDFIIAIRYALLKKSAKQKFSILFLIIISIFTITLDKLAVTGVSTVRAVLNDFVYHVSVVSSQPEVFTKNIFNKVKIHYRVMNENIYLKEEIEFFKQQKFNNAYLASENQMLKTALELSNLKGFEQDFSVSAKVVLDMESPFLKSILLNKGTRKNIAKGMTVFSKDYLLGTVIETNYLTSRVLLLTDLNSKIPIIIENTNVNGILEGTGKKDDLRLSYLPDNYEIENNKIIFTSGKDGFLMPGIPVAQTYLDKKNKISIKLLSDPDQALIVNVTNGQIKK